MSTPVRGVATAQETGIWDAGTLATNPLANDILVDSGALSAGDYFFQLLAQGDVAYRTIIEQRRAAATIKSFEVPVGADQFVQPIFGTKIALQANDSVRTIIKAGVTGNVQNSLLHARIVS